ncbi:MAG: hypothetical protein O7B98_01455 [Alphaproteobacteria bacterium]|nr:hypothetical protein [Alphaproteobacteria bacterium]MCZ6589790.1 hypothetical protein [Alphaproteobacteria bacterium]
MAENVVTVVESAPAVVLGQDQVLLSVNEPETGAPQTAVLERLTRK